MEMEKLILFFSPNRFRELCKQVFSYNSVDITRNRYVVVISVMSKLALVEHNLTNTISATEYIKKSVANEESKC